VAVLQEWVEAIPGVCAFFLPAVLGPSAAHLGVPRAHHVSAEASHRRLAREGCGAAAVEGSYMESFVQGCNLALSLSGVGGLWLL
jgi:hypothetical protein